MSRILGFLGPALVAMACAHPAPNRAGESSATPASAASPSAAPSILGPAHLVLLSQAPIAMSAFKGRPEPVTSLRPDAVGYIDGTGARALATLTEVRVIPGPADLKAVCVAADGRTTFARSRSADQHDKLWRADAFDGPMVLLGERAETIGRSMPGHEVEWLVSDAGGISYVDCKAGTVERVAGRARSAYTVHWTDAVRLARVRPEEGGEHCVLRTPETGGFAELPYCAFQGREDGSSVINKAWPGVPKLEPGQKPPPPVCLFVLDRDGKKHPCGTPVVPATSAPAPVRHQSVSLAEARFFAKGRVVAPDREQGLFRLAESDVPEAKDRVGPDSLGRCQALLPAEPVFACADPGFDVVVRVEPDGTLAQELRRPRPPAERAGERREARFNHTTDGGLAAGGDCEGNLSEAACVRDRSGNWHTVAFSQELVKALNRTAPVTRLVSSADGRLYVGTGTLDRGPGPRAGPGFGLEVGGDIRIVIFPAAGGAPTSIANLPGWIIEGLAGLGDDARPDEGHLDLGFVAGGHLRAWPFDRKHPVFHTGEHCRVDIALDGTFDTQCTQGRLFATGRLGLLQKRLGEIFETLDAGGTWTRVALPTGLETSEIACTPIGCRIGPYWREGWGEAGRGR
jgi:hypothetical protein